MSTRFRTSSVLMGRVKCGLISGSSVEMVGRDYTCIFSTSVLFSRSCVPQRKLKANRGINAIIPPAQGSLPSLYE